MTKEKLSALIEFMRQQNITVSELKQMSEYAAFYNGIPLMEAGEELPLMLRYSDNSVSDRFTPMHRIKSVHLEDVDVDLNEFSIPMSYLNGLQNCRQAGKKMLTEKQAVQIYHQFNEVNAVLTAICAEPFRKSRYWLSDQASKTYLAKAFDFSTGKVVELKRNDGCRIRPVLFKL